MFFRVAAHTLNKSKPDGTVPIFADWAQLQIENLKRPEVADNCGRLHPTLRRYILTSLLVQVPLLYYSGGLGKGKWKSVVDWIGRRVLEYPNKFFKPPTGNRQKPTTGAGFGGGGQQQSFGGGGGGRGGGTGPCNRRRRAEPVWLPFHVWIRRSDTFSLETLA